MKIYVDADACPKMIKEVLFKAAKRTKVEMLLVANHFMRIPDEQNITFQLAKQGFDVADDIIVSLVKNGDLVITGDIPLSAEAIEKGAHIIAPRGELLTEENVKTRLQIRDFMDTMRASGMETEGPKPMSKRDVQNFANQLDRFLQKNL